MYRRGDVVLIKGRAHVVLRPQGAGAWLQPAPWYVTCFVWIDSILGRLATRFKQI
jgi:hypothetical protein